jgi:hypothetical protein
MGELALGILLSYDKIVVIKTACYWFRKEQIDQSKKTENSDQTTEQV